MNDSENSLGDNEQGGHTSQSIVANENYLKISKDDSTPEGETTSLRTGSQVNRRIKYSDVTNSIVLVVLCAGLAIVIALSAATLDKLNKQTTTVVVPPYVNVVYPAIGLPGYENYSWNDVLTLSTGSQVNIWIANVNPSFNSWVDTWLAPQMLSLFAITVVRKSITATSVAINQISTELAANNTAAGSVDLVWLNGESFANGMTKKLLYGPFATKLPNAANFDFKSTPIAYDFGRLTSGFEMPLNQAQFVLIYNMIYFPSGPPQSLPDLVTWIKANPGKFAYPDPSKDVVTGLAFIKHFLYYYPATETFEDMLGDFNSAAYTKHAPSAFRTLKEIVPFLYQRNGQPYYPSNNTELDGLYVKGTVYMTMSYAPAYAGQMVAKGIFPNSTMAYVLKTGTIANTNFMAIGVNAKNKMAALVTANHMASAPAMFTRRQPERWGAIQAYDPQASFLSLEGWQSAFDYLKTYKQTPTAAQLRAVSMTELVATYSTTFKSDWYKVVFLNGTI